MKTICKKILPISLLIIALTSCNPDKTPAVEINASISIIGADNTVILDKSDFTLPENSSVLELLLLAVEKNDIPVDITGFGSAAYIRAIDNLYEFDYGASSGWVYYVNDSLPSVGAGGFKLKDSDSVQFIYLTEQTF